MGRVMQGPALRKLRERLRAESPRGYEGFNQPAVAERLPFSLQGLMDIEAGDIPIVAETSRLIHAAIMAGVATSSENGKS